LLGRALDAPVAKGADNFYERQYRQCLNPTMGAFAMTATRAYLASGDRGRVRAAMIEGAASASPILVIDSHIAAVATFLPLPHDGDAESVDRWLAGDAAMPRAYRRIVKGDACVCAEPRARARRRPAAGALIETLDAVRASRKLAILAAHPHDPDAMALHVTLFDAATVTADALECDHGLGRGALDAWRYAAWRARALLRFCVGGVEEAFTQCSQNLFVKRPLDAALQAVAPPPPWLPSDPLDALLGDQFELTQMTASASGLPGVSPRNGDYGKAGFVARTRKRTVVLIPYFAGNSVHGHAAKLWSNPRGTLLVADDHSNLCAVTLSGPCRTVAHGVVARDFPLVAAKVAERRNRKGAPAQPPEYWFLQEVEEIVQQIEPLAPNALDSARPTCSIHASGEAHHGKKPAYFAADTLPAYDRDLQHAREAAGRPFDPYGQAHRAWMKEVGGALDARRAHLAEIGG
jgi:hypothetical protein